MEDFVGSEWVRWRADQCTACAQEGGEYGNIGDALGLIRQDWQVLYRYTKAGIVPEPYIYHGARPIDNEQYSAEVFYSVSAGVRHDCRLMLGYFGRVLGGFHSAR